MSPADRLEEADQLHEAGNYQECLVRYRELLQTPKEATSAALVRSLEQALDCLRRLNSHHEADALLESVATTFAENWTVLVAVAKGFESLDHYGVMTAGEFVRAHNEGDLDAGSVQETWSTRWPEIVCVHCNSIGRPTNCSPNRTKFGQLPQHAIFSASLPVPCGRAKGEGKHGGCRSLRTSPCFPTSSKVGSLRCSTRPERQSHQTERRFFIRYQIPGTKPKTMASDGVGFWLS